MLQHKHYSPHPPSSLATAQGTNHVDEKYQLLSVEPVQDLVFFNYHEFLALQPRAPSLVINHFPNYHVSEQSETFHTTRIVRIPRCYTRPYSDIVPQFSTTYPGNEAGAIKNEEGEDHTLGTFEGHTFGVTSQVATLSNIISEEELRVILDKINLYLVQAYNPYSWQTAIESMIDVFCGGIFIQILNLLGIHTHTKRIVNKLEQYTLQLNKQFESKGRDLKIISPRRTGYLSVCKAVNTGKPYIFRCAY